jgi:hypothetical protein
MTEITLTLNMTVSDTVGLAIADAITTAAGGGSEDTGTDEIVELTIATDGDSHTLPLASGGTFDFVIDWGDGTSDHITAYDQAEITHSYTLAGVYTRRISGVASSIGYDAADALSKSQLTKVLQLGVIGRADIYRAFWGTGITEFTAGNCDPVASSWSYVFYGCSSLTTVDITGLTEAGAAPTSLYGLVASSSCTDVPGLEFLDITNVTTMAKTPFNNLPTARYNAVLESFASQAGTAPVNSVNFGSSVPDSAEAIAARTSLVSTYGWTVADGDGTHAP